MIGLRGLDIVTGKLAEWRLCTCAVCLHVTCRENKAGSELTRRNWENRIKHIQGDRNWFLRRFPETYKWGDNIKKQSFPYLSSSFCTTLLLSCLPYSVILRFILLTLSSPFLKCPDQHNVLRQTQDTNSRNIAFATQTACYDEFIW